MTTTSLPQAAAAAPDAAAVAAECSPPAPAPPAPSGSGGGESPTTFKAVDLDALAFESIEREGKLYVVRLRPRLLLVTPPMTLAGALVDADGEPLPFANLAPPAPFAAFLRRAEAAVLDACLANKAAWFRKDLDDDALRAGFKSFLKPNGTIKVKVPDDLAAFDAAKAVLAPGDVAAGAQVRAVLELAKVSFGKTEFGAMWRLVQVRQVAVPRCLIDDAADAGAGEDEDEDFL